MTVVYKPFEVMDMLDLKESTYKKYILELEKEGYVIQKDGRTRYFTEEDIKTLEQFMELLKYDGITIPMAAKKVAERKGKMVITEEPKSYDVMSLVSTALEEQEKRFEIRTQQLLEQQGRQFLERLERIESLERKGIEDHDKLLMQSIRESQETKKMMVEVKEQIAATQEEKKKSWLGRLFNI